MLDFWLVVRTVPCGMLPSSMRLLELAAQLWVTSLPWQLLQLLLKSADIVLAQVTEPHEPLVPLDPVVDVPVLDVPLVPVVELPAESWGQRQSP